MMQSVVRWFIAQLETPCPDGCDNGTVPNTAGLVAHERQLAEARTRSGWNTPRHTAREDYLDVVRAAPADTATCSTCSGRGVVLTEAGRAALEFLARHQSGADS